MHEHGEDGGATVMPTGKYTCPCIPQSSPKGLAIAKCGMALELMAPAASKTIYTCPMHPEIERDHPGDCPICGMSLEPKTVGAEDSGEHAEVRSLSRKFWIALGFTLPVLFIAMGHLIPGLHIEGWIPKSVSKWIEFVLATPVVLWAGRMFFSIAWRSLVNRSLNMFTLIATGVGAAYFYSAVAVIASGIFPESFREGGEVGLYFEAAAVITVLVLLGQLLEAKARSQTCIRNSNRLWVSRWGCDSLAQLRHRGPAYPQLGRVPDFLFGPFSFVNNGPQCCEQDPTGSIICRAAEILECR